MRKLQEDVEEEHVQEDKEQQLQQQQQQLGVDVEDADQ